MEKQIDNIFFAMVELVDKAMSLKNTKLFAALIIGVWIALSVFVMGVWTYETLCKWRNRGR